MQRSCRGVLRYVKIVVIYTDSRILSDITNGYPHTHSICSNVLPKCFFCGSKRQRNLILVGEDALGNPELPAGDSVHDISKSIRYHEQYKTSRKLYWVCRRCFYINPSTNARYRDISEKRDSVKLSRVEYE